jgi:hypothetical protein
MQQGHADMTDDYDLAAMPEADRRNGDRRRVRILHRHERRTGFDRRAPEGAAAAASEGALRFLRDNDLVLAAVLVTFNVLNVLDLVLTFYLLAFGAREGNPVMEALLGRDPLTAGVFKVVVLGLVSMIVWKMRRYRSMLAVSVLALLVFVGLTGYELFMLAHLV